MSDKGIGSFARYKCHIFAPHFFAPLLRPVSGETAEAVTPTFRGGDLEVTTTARRGSRSGTCQCSPLLCSSAQRRGNSCEFRYASLYPREARHSCRAVRLSWLLRFSGRPNSQTRIVAARPARASMVAQARRSAKGVSRLLVLFPPAAWRVVARSPPATYLTANHRTSPPGPPLRPADRGAARRA